MSSITLPNEEIEHSGRFFGRDITNMQSKESLEKNIIIENQNVI